MTSPYLSFFYISVFKARTYLLGQSEKVDTSVVRTGCFSFLSLAVRSMASMAQSVA